LNGFFGGANPILATLNRDRRITITCKLHTSCCALIVAGILVADPPRIGAYIVMLWLWGINVNLLLIPGFYDVVLRDFGLSLGDAGLGETQARVLGGVRPFGS
jgi:hypothetical protein